MKATARASVALLTALTAFTAHSAILKFDTILATAPDLVHPDCGEPGRECVLSPISVTFDTSTTSIDEVTYYDFFGDGQGPVLWRFSISGAKVLAISFTVNGIDLMSDPAGLELTFGGENFHPSSRWDAGFGGTNQLGQSISVHIRPSINMTPTEVEQADDLLATILLRDLGGESAYMTGAWGTYYGGAGPHLIEEVVPLPGSIWMLGTALAGLGGRKWLRRRAH